MGNRLKRFRPWAALLVAILCTGSLTACGGGAKPQLVQGDWNAVVAAAKAEGEVVVYAGTSESQNTRLVDAFNQKYPNIAVQLERSSGNVTARVDAERQAAGDGADVFLDANSTWFADNADALLPATGPNAAGLREGSWVVPDKAVNTTVTPYSVIVWNTQKFPNGFRTYEDLLDPSVKGLLAVRGDATPSAAGYVDFLEEELGADYLSRLGEQDPKLYPSTVPATQAVASGEVGVTNASFPSLAMQMQASGAPVDYIIPNPGYAIGFGSAALANAHRPNAAVVFFDFMLSPEGQAALNSDGYGAAARDGVPSAIDLSSFAVLDSARYTPEVLVESNAKMTKYFH